ncbi:cytochrome P450, partial [Zychaea mexicana]|uniref:cytochrome P450 n=1 Tax=Zychaea mexicana TaxID=64656 RepID=UPI0022FF3826
IGPIIRINMGVKPWVIIGDPYLAHEILKVNDAVTSGRPYHLYLSKYHTMNRKGMVYTNADKQWKRCRAIAQTVLGRKGVAQLSQTMESEASRVTSLLLECGKVVDVSKYMQLYTQNVMLQALFGISSTAIDDSLFTSVVETVDIAIKWSAPVEGIRSFLPGLAKSLGLYKNTAMSDFIEKKRNPLYRRLIQQSLESDTPCLVKELYRVKKQNEFDDDDILVLIVNMVNAGTDTTAMTLSWAMILLCHHKDVQKRLHGEVDSFIFKHNRLPVYDERENFPFLISVQKECMRFRAPNHFALPRETTDDLECQGFFIPKGTVLLSNTYTLNRSPDFYDRPEKFIPERYLDDQRPLVVSANANLEKRDQYTFGWGRRLCPGAHMVDVELFNFWVRILATTTIEPPLNENGDPVYPDLNSYRDIGVAIAPLDSRIRFVERHDRLI